MPHLLRLFASFALLLPASANPPAWWLNGAPPILTGTAENNKGPANIGQTKWMAARALAALDAYSPGIANQIRADLEGSQPDHSDRVVDLSVPDPKTADWLEKQHAPLLIGQLKAIAKPFYDRLNAPTAAPAWLAAECIANGTNVAGTHLPWTATTADDSNRSTATIGQLKAVFSLRFDTDSDSDGIPDLAEWILINQSTSDGLVTLADVTPETLSPTPYDSDGDGKTSISESDLGLNPLLKDNPKVMLQVTEQ